jgi:hypothetical protein
MAQEPATGKAARWRRRLTVSACVLGALLLVQGVRCLGGSRLDAATERGAPVEREMPDRLDAPDLKEYESITAGGHFGKDKPPPQPKLFGVLGEYALLGSAPEKADLHKVGAKLPGDYVLTEIGADHVVLEKDGKKQTLKLFGDPMPTHPSGPPPDAQKGGPGPGAKEPEGKADGETPQARDGSSTPERDEAEAIDENAVPPDEEGGPAPDREVEPSTARARTEVSIGRTRRTGR